jgi:hypothetical protein
MSEPKVLLLHGNSGRWSASDRPEQAAWENSCESWIFAFGGDFIHSLAARASDLQGYDIIIANSDAFALEHLTNLSQSRPQGTKWVTLIEGDVMDFVKPRRYIRKLFDNSDLVNCINKFTLDFFRKLTTSHVEYIGFPYPAETIRSFSTSIEKRTREIFLMPFLLSRSLEYYCAKDMGIPFYGYEKKITRNWRTMKKNIFKHRSFNRSHYLEKARNLYDDPSLSVEMETTLPNYFRRNSRASLWLNLDHRFTWGRNILDAAAMQIPIITTRSTGQAEHFFPDTMLENEFEIEKARQLILRLFQDKDFYKSVATVPLEKFDHLRPEVKKKELLDALYPS